MLLHHYRFIDTYFNHTFPFDLLQEQITLWKTMRADDTYSIELTVSDYDLEGDLSLVLKKNLHKVYVLSFTIVPGELIQLGPGHSLFVSRIQGVKNPEMIRAVTKALGEASPPMILLTAARAIAMASGIGCLAGVSSAVQVTAGEERPAEQACFFNYDEFWHSKGGIKMDNGIFRLRVTPHSKPDEEVTGKHRSRTLRKRRFNDELLGECRMRFEQTCIKGGTVDSTERTKWSIHAVATPLIAFATEAFAFY